MHSIDYLKAFPSAGTPIQSPLAIDHGAPISWDEECDLLIIGLGCAGATAAIRAAELGVGNIIAVDRCSGGGASMSSGGVVYAGGGTPVQLANGHADTPQSMFDYLAQEIGDVRSKATLRRFVDESRNMIAWLETHDMVFQGKSAQKKTSHPPAGINLYYTGNEKIPAYAAHASPAPRGHRPEPPGGNPDVIYGGVILMRALLGKVARTQAIRTFFQAACHRLITESGSVVGAEIWRVPPGLLARLHARCDALSNNPRLSAIGLGKHLWLSMKLIERLFARPVKIQARGGVVLATGGHINNPEIADRAAPVYRGVARLGTVGDDGSALRLGHSVGAKLERLDRISPWKFIVPPEAWISGILVSRSGERFVNEELYGAHIGKALFQKAGGHAWLIIDSAIHQAAAEELDTERMWDFQELGGKLAMRLATRADTIEELAHKLGMPEAALRASIEEHNRLVTSGEPDRFGRGNEYRRPIVQAPFHALNQSYNVKTNPVPGITLGGIAVDETTNQALDGQGQPIAGLYAIGRSAVGICSENYVSGLSLADCIWSGWQAAQAVADHLGARPAQSVANED